MIGKISYIMKRTGDNAKFVYIPKREQKAKFVYKELSAIAGRKKSKYQGMLHIKINRR